MNRKLAAQCLSELGNLTRLDIYRLLVRAGLDGMNIGDIQTRLGAPGTASSPP
jgi:ArsR family transcriptional regulator